MKYCVIETDSGWIVVKLGPPIIMLASFTDIFAAERLAAELNR